MVKNFFDNIAIRTRLGFLIAFLLLILSYILTFISTQKVISQANRVNQTNKVIHDLDKILSYVVYGESSFRGYLISKDKMFLQKYEDNVSLVDSTLNILHTRIENNPEQVSNLEILRNSVRTRISWINDFNKHFPSRETGIKLLQEELIAGTKTTELIEKQVNKMQSIESEIWQKRGKEVSEYTGLIKMFNTISIILAILFALFSLIVYNKENKAKQTETRRAREFRKQLESRIDELADLNKELIDLRSQEKYAVTGRIARTIAHEVRNPLTSINLSIEQLRSEVPETETTELFFNMIVRNSERINNLVSDLLNSTRVTELNFAEANINELLDDSLAMASDRIDLKQIRVIRHYEPEICTISADIQKIKVAFLNILVNAIEAMDPKGTLTVRTLTDKDKCVVKIIDNGVGMSKEQLDKLFEPYYTTKEKGNGLGLAHSQNIILGHNGSVSVDSILGEGSTFTITLGI